MKNRLVLLLWVMCAITFTAEAALWDRFITNSRQVEQAPTIRALIVHDVPNALLEVNGKYMILDSHGKEIASRVNGKRRLIEVTLDGLRWGEDFPDRFAITLVPTGRDSVLLVNGTPYRGNLTIQGFRDSNTLSIVNNVDVENYLASILGVQIVQTYPAEVLNAVAIAERTHVYNQTLHPKNDHWDVDTSKTGYVGVGEFPKEVAVNKAVAATRYMVLGRPAESAGDVELVPVKWEEESTQRGVLSLNQATKQADNGEHAGQILGQIKPNVAIVRVFF